MKSKLVRFAGVGGATFVIYFSLQFLFEEMGFGRINSVSASYLIAISLHFLCNFKYTFGHNALERIDSRMLIGYALVNALNYLISIGAVYVFISFGAPVQVGMCAGIIVTTITGFYLYNTYVFVQRQK